MRLSAKHIAFNDTKNLHRKSSFEKKLGAKRVVQHEDRKISLWRKGHFNQLFRYNYYIVKPSNPLPYNFITI